MKLTLQGPSFGFALYSIAVDEFNESLSIPDKKQVHTLKAKRDADGVITYTSEAVDALCIARISEVAGEHAPIRCGPTLDMDFSCICP